MEAGGIAALGLDWKALLFQLANFAILLGILRMVAYKPILAGLEARRRRIEEGLKNADQVETLKNELVVEQAKLLKKAQDEAGQIVERSKQQAQHVAATITEQAQKAAEQVATQTKAQLQQEISQARQALKKETAMLVVAATEKILHAKLDEKTDHKLVRDSLESL